MRGRIGLIGVGLLLLAGCGEDPASPRAELPPPKVVRLPAASAGGACRLLDYPTIEQTIGVRFDVSAASRHGKTDTCVVRTEQARHPELALSVSPTTADAEVFADEVAPRGASTVKGLGKAGYRSVVSAERGSGPGVEVGWLSRDGRLVHLRYTFPAGDDQPAASQFASKLVALAKQIDANGR